MNYYRVYYGKGTSAYDDHPPLIWSDEAHPCVTDEDWRRMKAGETVIFDDGWYYGIMTWTPDTYTVDYFGGESRKQPGKSCDYLLCYVDDEDGKLVELYAEALCPDDVTEETIDDWSDGVYDDLKAEIIEQAKEYGIVAEQLEF